MRDTPINLSCPIESPETPLELCLVPDSFVFFFGKFDWHVNS